MDFPTGQGAAIVQSLIPARTAILQGLRNETRTAQVIVGTSRAHVTRLVVARGSGCTDFGMPGCPVD